METNRLPNILLLIADEHRADISSIEGNDIIKTPVLQALADKGTYFRNAYCTSAVCVPSRQSFLSGKLPRTINCKSFGDPFDSSIVTIPEHLTRYGYHTVAYGKMHFEDKDQMHGWSERPMGDISVQLTSPLADDAEYVSMTKEESVSKGLGKWTFDKEISNARVIGEYEGRRGIDLRTTEAACEYLERYFADSSYDRPNSNQPLLFSLSLYNPHFPFQCTKDDFEYYLTRVRPYIEEPPNDHPCHKQYGVQSGVDVTEREIHRATAAYYGQIEFMDTMFGKVMDTLKKLNKEEEFIVIYIADHGEMLGQHGCWEKKQFYDGASRVPFIIYDPRKPKGHEINEVVSLLDLFPTICDLAGIKKPEDLEGDSLMNLMNAEEDNWRNEAISELWSWYHGGKGSYMIRQGDFKYNHYYHPDYPEQLFDLGNDPDERNNLVNEKEYQEVLTMLRLRGRDLMPQIDR